MLQNKRYCSRTYWQNYINSIIESIEEDKDSIIDMIMFGRVEKAEVVMSLCADEYPNYQIKICKIAEKSPFGEDEEE
jgi:ribulose kinase